MRRTALGLVLTFLSVVFASASIVVVDARHVALALIATVVCQVGAIVVLSRSSSAPTSSP
jgi:hypothetical protein